MVVPPAKRIYQSESIPACGFCQSRRVFECQLMPNLINVLTSHGSKGVKEKEKQGDGKENSKGGDKMDEMGGMEWGTCIIFSCEKDCCDDEKECWREEIVLVQWDE
jgi:pre-rRNA-processing protein TSR4